MIQQDINYYKNFDSIAKEVLALLAQTIEVNTFFLSIVNPIQSFMIKSFNRNAKLICEGDILPYNMAYCKLVVENGLEPLVIPNLGKHECGAPTGSMESRCSGLGIWSNTGIRRVIFVG